MKSTCWIQYSNNKNTISRIFLLIIGCNCFCIFITTAHINIASGEHRTKHLHKSLHLPLSDGHVEEQVYWIIRSTCTCMHDTSSGNITVHSVSIFFCTLFRGVYVGILIIPHILYHSLLLNDPLENVW